MIDLQRLLNRFAEHLVVLNGRQPVRRRCGEVITGTETAAFDKRPDAEFFQARSRRDQRLTATVRASVSMLKSRCYLKKIIHIKNRLILYYQY